MNMTRKGANLTVGPKTVRASMRANAAISAKTQRCPNTVHSQKIDRIISLIIDRCTGSNWLTILL
jgi:hypothetical protein